MSWDLVIVKIRGDFRPLAQVRSDDYIPLGSLPAVQLAIRTALPSADWSSPTWIVYLEKDLVNGKEFAIEANLDGIESHQTITLHTHGPGDPVPALLQLTEANGWLIVDCSRGEFIDPKNPSSER
jgi:hypothetical protein